MRAVGFLRRPVHLYQLLETVAHYCSDPDHLDALLRLIDDFCGS